MVKRYVVNSDCPDGVVQEHEHGPFVRYSDYEMLETNVARLDAVLKSEVLSYEKRVVGMMDQLSVLEAEVARLRAWKQRAIDLKASSALVAFVSTYYDNHTPEAWDALCKLSDEFKAALSEDVTE